MSNLSEEELLQIWQDVFQNLPPAKPVFFRLYYNDDGTPIIYSMEELPGNYIDVDRPTYASTPFNVRVVAGKLIYIDPVITVKKLQPSDLAGTACDPCDVCVVVNLESPHIKWNLANNELN